MREKGGSIGTVQWSQSLSSASKWRALAHAHTARAFYLLLAIQQFRG